jgi:Kef-type K+ transport system membrane component KefB
VFSAHVLLVILAMAFLTGLAGLSLPLGAFLAGHADLRDRVPLPRRRRIKPFRDVLLACSSSPSA